jgi:hypothetical protein
MNNAWAWKGVGPLAATIFLLVFVAFVAWVFYHERQVKRGSTVKLVESPRPKVDADREKLNRGKVVLDERGEVVDARTDDATL